MTISSFLLTMGIFIVIFIIGELLFSFIWFKPVAHYFKRHNETLVADDPAEGKLSRFRGYLERLVLAACFLLNLSQVLFLFGALKLGVMLSGKKKLGDDHFITENMSSVLIALLYAHVYGFANLLLFI